MANPQPTGILSFATNVLRIIVSSLIAFLLYLLQNKRDERLRSERYASYIVWARQQALIISEGERDLGLTINIGDQIDGYVDVNLITMSHLLTTIKEHPVGIGGRAGA